MRKGGENEIGIGKWMMIVRGIRPWILEKEAWRGQMPSAIGRR